MTARTDGSRRSSWPSWPARTSLVIDDFGTQRLDGRERSDLQEIVEGRHQVGSTVFTPHGCRRTAAALYRRVAGSAVSKAIVGHTTDRMHEHYAVVSTAERNAAARGAFRLLQGGSQEEGGKGGIQRGDRRIRDQLTMHRRYWL